MNRKYFTQPEFMVVHLDDKDIVTASEFSFSTSLEIAEENAVGVAGRRFDEWEEGF